MNYKDGANCFLEQVSEDLTVLVLDYKLSNSNVALEAIVKELDKLFLDGHEVCTQLREYLEK